MAAIEFSGVSKSYGTVAALQDVSLSVKDNEFFCVFGPPTSGKTTVLRLILGLEEPDVGDIRIGGRSVRGAGPGERNVAMVFQNLALFPHMTAGDNIRFPLVERAAEPTEIDRRVAAVADKLHIGRLLDKMPAHLSGGERQRVAIARALVRDPSAYLMDDPISALDARLREETRVELKRIQRELGHTLVYVTHDQEESMSVADRMAILEHGRVVQIDTPDEIYNRPTSRYVAELVGSPRINIVRGRVSNGRFETDDGRAAFALAAGVEFAPSVDLGARPEDIVIGAADAGLVGEVLRVEALGGYTVLAIGTASGLVVRSARRGLPRLAVGEKIGFTIDPTRIHLFDAASGRRLNRGSSDGWEGN